MTGTALTSNEKHVAPKIKLKNDVKTLNEYVKNTHRTLIHNETMKRLSEKKEDINKSKERDKFKKEFRNLTTPKENKLYKSVSRKSNTHECNTKYLARIMTSFYEIKDNEMLCLKDIHNFTGLNNDLINTGLKFLVHFNIVEEIQIKSRYFYKLATPKGRLTL